MREAEEKARRVAEARAKAEAEAKAKREAKFAKREAQLKKRVAEAEAAPGARSKKAAALIATIVVIVGLAIGGVGYYLFAPGDIEQKKMIEAMQRQLEESKKRETELQQAKEREEQARIALEKARAATEEVKLAAAPAAAAGGEALYKHAAALELQGKGKDAVKLYVRAARSGNGRAAKRLGEIYDKGVAGVSRDYAESRKWYKAARVLGEKVPMAKTR
jgi:NADH dehydrogenase [ubiquinone] 1 alpha subcomplex assembly factor 7